MNQPNFNTMTRDELRAYLLDHRNDEAAFHAYMDKLASEAVLIPGQAEELEDSARFAETLARIRQVKREQRT
jgi:hypothetical protein